MSYLIQPIRTHIAFNPQITDVRINDLKVCLHYQIKKSLKFNADFKSISRTQKEYSQKLFDMSKTFSFCYMYF